jgi:mono/diheme cytochrome c family protein
VSDLAKTRLRWAAGALVAAAIVGAIIALVLFLGGFDIAANRPWSQPATWLIHRTMMHSVRARSGAVAPPQRFTPEQVQRGFRLYDEHCAMCHGGPGVAREPWTAGLEPSPPYLLDAAHRWSRADLFWIIHNGVKMTGMPSWQRQLTGPDTWSVVGFLEALPNITAADYARLRQAAAPPGERQPTGGGR